MTGATGIYIGLGVGVGLQEKYDIANVHPPKGAQIVGADFNPVPISPFDIQCPPNPNSACELTPNLGMQVPRIGSTNYWQVENGTGALWIPPSAN